MAASTHKGHCQACGRLQMLPSGKLAKHGYTVKGGFFSGVCRGSSFLPFELSCDQVKRYIAEAQASLGSLVAFQATLRATLPEGANQAYFRASLASPKGRYYGSVRGPWAVRTITEEVIPFRDSTGSYSKFYVDGDTAWKRDATSRDGYSVQPVRTEVQPYGHGKNLRQIAQDANEAYAKELDREVKSLQRYIAWQIDRVETWKLAPLFPVSAKDKLGFDPEAK